MSKTKLYRISGQKTQEIPSSAVGLEKSLQTVIEKNLVSLLGIRFLSSEYGTGRTHGGRIDTLGVDENGCPVIIEYKRTVNENIINQGLFYLDWLLDHKAEFKLLVQDSFGKDVSEVIDWSAPRLVCVAADFTKYDEYAVKQINRNIDLIRYRRFGDDLLALDLVWRTTADDIQLPEETAQKTTSNKTTDKPFDKIVEELDQPMRDLYEFLRANILALGDDVSEKRLKLYVAYRRIKTFASVVVQKKQLLIYVQLDPDEVTLEDGFTRDVRKIGHWATGNLVITVTNKEQLNKAQPLIARSYEEA
jgi:predicted transport protein